MDSMRSKRLLKRRSRTWGNVSYRGDRANGTNKRLSGINSPIRARPYLYSSKSLLAEKSENPERRYIHV